MNHEPETLYILGPGSTLYYIRKKLKIDKTLLGVDCVVHNRLISKDVNESKLLELIETYPQRKIVVSPIGAQGFILGRGNLQLTSRVIEKVGVNNIIIVSTPGKLQHTPLIRVDIDDKNLIEKFKEMRYIFVVTGTLTKVVKEIYI